MDRDGLIKNQKRNAIIVGVIFSIGIVLSLFLPMFKANYIMAGVNIILLIVMWLSAKEGQVISGIIGIILSILLIISWDILNIVLGIMLLIDSIKYVAKINKV